MTAERGAEITANAEAIEWLKPPAFDRERFSERQIEWAIKLFRGERYFWHAKGYAIADLNLFLQSPEARSAKWWIDSCKDAKNGMANSGREALDKVLDRIKQPGPTPAMLSLKLKVGYPDRQSA